MNQVQKCQEVMDKIAEHMAIAVKDYVKKQGALTATEAMMQQDKSDQIICLPANCFSLN